MATTKLLGKTIEKFSDEGLDNDEATSSTEIDTGNSADVSPIQDRDDDRSDRAKARHALFPGLPDDLTLECIVPRLRWNVRPAMVAVSRSWRKALHDPYQYAIRTRELQDPPEGLLLLHFAGHSLERLDALIESGGFVPDDIWDRYQAAISILERGSSKWQRLPPVSQRPNGSPPFQCCFVCHQGKVFLLGSMDKRPEVYMLDLASGMWKWERRSSMPNPRHYYSSCVAVNGKIFISGPDYKGRRRSAGNGELVHCLYGYDIAQDIWTSSPLDCMRLKVVCVAPYVDGRHLMVYNAQQGHVIEEDGTQISRVECPFRTGTAAFISIVTGKLVACSSDGQLRCYDAAKDLWNDIKVLESVSSYRGRGFPGNSMIVHEICGVELGGEPRVYASTSDSTGRPPFPLWRGELQDNLRTVVWQLEELPFTSLLNRQHCLTVLSSKLF